MRHDKRNEIAMVSGAAGQCPIGEEQSFFTSKICCVGGAVTVLGPKSEATALRLSDATAPAGKNVHSYEQMNASAWWEAERRIAHIRRASQEKSDLLARTKGRGIWF